MAYKEVLRVDILEVIRRWRSGHSQRRIASGTGLSRDTVARYITTAAALGVSPEGGEPSEEQLSRLAALGQPGPRQATTPSEDLLAPWADQIHRWLTGDRLLTRIQELLQLTRIQELLGEGLPGIVCLPAALRGPPPLAKANQGHGADGRDAAW